METLKVLLRKLLIRDNTLLSLLARDLEKANPSFSSSKLLRPCSVVKLLPRITFTAVRYTPSQVTRRRN